MGDLDDRGVNGDGLFSNIPKFIAVAGVLPLLILCLWFTWKLSAAPRLVHSTWTLVEANVVEGAPEGMTALEWTWNGQRIRRELERKDDFQDLSPGMTLPLYVNPADAREIRPGGFARLWGGVMAVGVVALFLAVTAAFLWRVRSPEMPEELKREFQRSFSEPRQPDAQSRQDDGRVIEMREPRESWKANVFWGLLFGLLMIGPSVFAPADTPAWKRFGLMALGLAWMGFMGRMAIRNRGRKVRCDQTSIEITDPLGSRRILLSEVKQVTRCDVREKLREFDDVGRPRYKTKPLDTLAPMVVYILRDEQGSELLRLDQKMDPPDEMRRFLDRMEALTGKPVRDE